MVSVNYWMNKEENAKIAREWADKMWREYRDEIEESVSLSQIYSPDSKLEEAKNPKMPAVCLSDRDTVSAIFDLKSCWKDGDKLAVLNFASYKHPGGMFLAGSSAQEESLCHESTLYDVLVQFDDDYYDWNARYLNKALYVNRALYSPGIVFVRNHELTGADVITCAAPNFTPGRRYGTVKPEENSEALRSRIKFVLDIAQENNNTHLILGAFGCGVFSQNPTEVATIFLDLLPNYNFKYVEFAVPDKNSANYKGFLAEVEKFGKREDTYVQVS